jgi:hypothetical protein
MLTSALVMLLCAAPVKIAASGFTVSGDDSARADVWLERFAEVMRRDRRIEVTTSADFAQVLGMERQKQLLGCATDSTSCITELANALGTDGVLVGTITRSGDSYLAVVRVIRQTNGSVWWSASGRMTGEPALLDWLDEQAAASVDAMAPAGKRRLGPLVLGAAGIVGIGTGAALVIVSNTLALDAVRKAGDEPTLAGALSSGQSQNTAGVLLLSVGAAVLTTAIVWLLVGGEAGATVALTPVPGGAVAGIGGRW